MGRVQTISTALLLRSELLSIEESHSLKHQLEGRLQLTSSDIIELDLPAKNRVEALLQNAFMEDKQLRGLACDFAEHTLHVFEEHAPRDYRPRKCIEAARLYLAGGSLEGVQRAVKDAIPAVWLFEKTELVSAFVAGLAVTFLDFDDAGVMAKPVATHCQRATHRKVWESRKSDLELMIGGEKEALWQLSRILEVLNLTHRLA